MSTPYDAPLPPGVAAFEKFLGLHGMSHVLAAAGVGSAAAPLPGLPVPPGPGGDYVERVARALRELVGRYPVGHLLVPPDVVALRAAASIPVPTTVWLPPGATAEVVGHFRASSPADVDVAVAPGLPRPRGILPALVVLGGLAGGLCHLPPASRWLVDHFQGEPVLGISAFVDPTDPTDRGCARHPGWPTVWASRFAMAARPADDEIDLPLAEVLR